MTAQVIDTLQLGQPSIIAATALETSDGVVLFDTGPESTFDNVLRGLESAGIRSSDVRHVFLSHIHFDHAGAAWRFAAPSGSGAEIYVHARGAPHLIDPARLVESAKRIFGGEMERLWGRIAPVPREKVHVIGDGESIRVGEFEIRAIETPGHASHHHVYVWNDNLFGGDVAGVRIKTGPVIPPFVPPELDIAAWQQSIDKMRSLGANTMYLPHYGKVEGNLGRHFDELADRVARWGDWFRARLGGGAGEQQLRSEFAALEHGEIRSLVASEALAVELINDYETADPSYMAAIAATRYWQKRGI